MGKSSKLEDQLNSLLAEKTSLSNELDRVRSQMQAIESTVNEEQLKQFQVCLYRWTSVLGFLFLRRSNEILLAKKSKRWKQNCFHCWGWTRGTLFGSMPWVQRSSIWNRRASTRTGKSPNVTRKLKNSNRHWNRRKRAQLNCVKHCKPWKTRWWTMNKRRVRMLVTSFDGDLFTQHLFPF